MSKNSPAPVPGATYRFVVKSAEEAVRIIHEKLGAEARVISVKQVGGRGLAGLIRSPQLEVIAGIVPAETPEPAAELPVAPSPVEEFDELENEILPELSEPTPAPAPRFTEPFERLLSRVGISDQILTRWRRSPRWEQLRTGPLPDSLKEVVEMLRALWPEPTAQDLGARAAFFGPPGSGSTTALCKALSADVFLRQEAAAVMKLDGDQPNPTEGLAMFCEALGVPLVRSAAELESFPNEYRFYFDAIGAALHDHSAWRDLGRLFGEFYIETRVLVLNAAYEIDVLKRAYAAGREAGATHVVFTHLDEIHHAGKLWELVLSGGLTPLFFSCGQSISGDLQENCFQYLIERTFGGLI